MCFPKASLSPPGVYRKRSDAVVRTNQSICFPQGMRGIVYSAAFISRLLFIHQNHTFSFFFFFFLICATNANCEKAKTCVYSGLFSPPIHPSHQPNIPFQFFPVNPLIPSPSFAPPSPPSSSPAHQPSHGSSERCPGPPGPAVVGARQRRPVPRALLHGAAQGAP